jgi:integrase
MSAKLKSILTRQIISQLRPGDETSDAACPGLRVRCTDTAKVFFYRYRLASGELRQIKLGEFGAMTLPAARNELARRRLEREQGIDPQEEKRKVRERAKSERAARGQGVYTVGQLVADYGNEVLCKQKRGAESKRVLRELAKKLGEQPAVGITRRILLNEVMRPAMLRAPRVATQLLSRIRCAYQHASDQGRLPDEFLSPTLGIKGAAQVRRTRAFTNAELTTFLRWLPHSPYSRDVRDALMLVLLTGCRSGEVVGARWRDIDLPGAVWTIRNPKNGQPHDVMLPRQAVEIFTYRRGIDPTFVFPSKAKGRHLTQKKLGFAQYTARQHDAGERAADPIEMAWTVHDLRRTVGTGLARLGCPRVVQDRVLNHVDSSVSAIYDVHEYDAEAREWLQKWADHLDRVAVVMVLRKAA